MIRQATSADLPRLVEMGKRFLDSSDYRQHLSENPDCFQKFISSLIGTDKNRVLVTEEGGEVHGMLVLVIYPHYFSGEVVAGEVIWWVDPEHRTSGSGLKLLREAEREAKEMGARNIQMIAPTERIEKLYRRFGYTKVETTFQRTLA